MKRIDTAYILLWFPKPSETFIFREIKNLFELGLPLSVYTLYGKLTKNISPEMSAYRGRIIRLGIMHVLLIPVFSLYWIFKSPVKTSRLIAFTLFRRWRGIEKTAENAWACLCSFYLAYRFVKDGILHIHAPWACGCATAAWFASRLTGIPFSFTIRAWDIYPPDSLINEKARDALFIRSETQYNINYLHELTGCAGEKFHLTYNGVPITPARDTHVTPVPPYQLLAVGRLVGKKGYKFLLAACTLLAEQQIPFHLDIVGDGTCMSELTRLCRSLQLSASVSFPGFLSYERIPEYYRQADIFIMPCVVDSSGDRDGIPTVLLEALMNHVPVITTPVSGIPELIEDGVTGLLIPPENPKAIADAVIRIITEKENTALMVEKGYEKVQKLFNPIQNHRRLLSLYNQYLSQLN